MVFDGTLRVDHLMNPQQNTLAIVYDFDHTLSPLLYAGPYYSSAEHRINPKDFWASCTALIKDKGYDQELAYMKRMLEHEQIKKYSNQDLQTDGAGPHIFPRSAGVFR